MWWKATILGRTSISGHWKKDRGEEKKGSCDWWNQLPEPLSFSFPWTTVTAPTPVTLFHLSNFPSIPLSSALLLYQRTPLQRMALSFPLCFVTSKFLTLYFLSSSQLYLFYCLRVAGWEREKHQAGFFVVRERKQRAWVIWKRWFWIDTGCESRRLRVGVSCMITHWQAKCSKE